MKFGAKTSAEIKALKAECGTSYRILQGLYLEFCANVCQRSILPRQTRAYGESWSLTSSPLQILASGNEVGARHDRNTSGLVMHAKRMKSLASQAPWFVLCLWLQKGIREDMACRFLGGYYPCCPIKRCDPLSLSTTPRNVSPVLRVSTARPRNLSLHWTTRRAR